MSCGFSPEYRKKLIKNYIIIHAGLAASLISLMLYHAAVEALDGLIVYCPMHDLFGIYCPFCGGTRAVAELLNFNLAGAVRANPAFIIFLLLFAVLDVRAAFMIFSKSCGAEKKVIPAWAGIFIAAIFILWFIIRNFFLIFLKIDFLGDFLPMCPS